MDRATSSLRKMFFRSVATASLIIGCAAAPSIAMAAKDGPVEDPLGVVKIGKDEPIVIAASFVMSGADAALGVDGKRAMDVYFSEIGNKILGRTVKLLVEDDGCSAEGGQTVGAKLAANQKVVGVVGSMCSGVVRVMAPLLWKQGIVSVGIGSAPSLTAPDRGAAMDGFLRTHPNNSLEAKASAEWMFNVMKWKTAATIHDGSTYSQELAANFGRSFEALGGKVVRAEAIAPNDTDMRPVLTRIATGSPDAIYFPVFIAAGGHITRQAAQIPGLTKNLVAGSNMTAKDYIAVSGTNVVGVRMTSPDISAEALGTGYPKLVKKYKDMFGEAPVQSYHAHIYDATKMLVTGIQKVAVKDNAGNVYIGRKALRDALFNLPRFDGMTGPIKCNQWGDCAQFKLAVFEFTDANPDTFAVGKNPKKIYSAPGMAPQ